MEKINESIYGMYQKWSSGNIRKEDQHSYVDLGLPSGLLWATCNLGADTPVDIGDYYRWGAVKPADESDKFVPYFDKRKGYYTKYNRKDGLTVLEPNDDAAHVNWGGDWRIPTQKECKELIDNCTIEDKSNFENSGVSGYLFISKNNNKEIFIPFGGYGMMMTNILMKGLVLNLWTSTLSNTPDGKAFYMVGGIMDYESDRHLLMNIRPVRIK